MVEKQKKIDANKKSDPKTDLANFHDPNSRIGRLESLRQDMIQQFNFSSIKDRVNSREQTLEQIYDELRDKSSSWSTQLKQIMEEASVNKHLINVILNSIQILINDAEIYHRAYMPIYAYFGEGRFTKMIDKGIQSPVNSLIDFVVDMTKDSSELRKDIKDILYEEYGQKAEKLYPSIDSTKLVDLVVHSVRSRHRFDFSYFDILNYKKNGIPRVLGALLTANQQIQRDENELFNIFLHHQNLIHISSIRSVKVGLVELIKILQDAEDGKDIYKFKKAIDIIDPYSNISTIPSDVLLKKLKGSFGDELVSAFSFANVDLKEKLEKGQVDLKILAQYILNTLKAKKMPILIGTDLYGRGRGVESSINDILRRLNGITLAKLIKFPMEVVHTLDNPSIGSTNGEVIDLAYAVSLLSTYELNLALFTKVYLHEVGHNVYGTFRYDPDYLTRIDLLEVLRDHIKDPKKIQQIEKANGLLNQVIAEVNHRLNEKFEKDAQVKLKDLYKIVGEVFDEYREKEDDENNKKFLDTLNALVNIFFSDVSNVFEDYRIDTYFERSSPKDASHVYHRSERDLGELQAMYRFGKYILLSVNAREYAELAKKAMEKYKQEHKEEAEHSDLNRIGKLAVNFPLSFTKLSEIFEEATDGVYDDVPAAYKEELKMLMAKMVKEDEQGNVIIQRASNESIWASFEYLAFIALVESIELPRSDGEGSDKEGKDGKQNGKDKKDGKEGNEENKKNGKEKKDGKDGEGKSKSGDNSKSGKRSKKTSIPKTGVGADKKNKENSEIKKGKMDEAGKNKKASEAEESNKPAVTGHVFINQEDVERYKQSLQDISTGEIEKEELLRTNGKQVALPKLVRLIHSGNPKEIFTQKRINVDERKGSDIFQRPIEIYVGVDTSGSMSGDRADSVVYESMALFAAYHQLQEEMKEKGIHLKFMSVAGNGDDLSIGEFDANQFEYIERPNGIDVNYSFEEVGGGTDLPGMLRSYRKKIQSRMEETTDALLKGKMVVNPSVLMVFFTDFGDNAGDVEGVHEQISEFVKFAENYREKSELIRDDSSMQPASIALIFGYPAVDDDRVYHAIDDQLREGTANVHDKENSVDTKISRLSSLLNGYDDALNIKKE